MQEKNKYDFNNALGDFRFRMGELARGFLRVSIEDSIFDEKIEKVISDEVVEESWVAAEEMLMPALVSFGANFGKLNTENLYKSFMFEAFDRWRVWVECRHDALKKQVINAKNMMGGKMVSVNSMNGDLHNGLKRLLKIKIVDSDSKEKCFVYKSVSSFPQKLVFSVGKVVSSRLGIDDITSPVFCEGVDGYLREFVECCGNKPVGDVSGYFYNFGVICSIASFLEIVDLHHENIIVANNGVPKIIDIELILASALKNDFVWSCINSGLFDYSSSPIGQKNRHRYLNPSVALNGRDVCFSVGRDQYSLDHILRSGDGVIVDPRDYASYIQRGAKDADDVIRSGGCELLNLIDVGEGGAVRVLFRSTAYYKILQIQIWLPCGDLDENISAIRKKLIGCALGNDRVDEKTKNAIIDAEISDIVRGDIPYFWVDCRRGDLMHSSGVIKKHFAPDFFESFSKRVKKWVLKDSSRDMSRVLGRIFSVS
ncbi:MAG: DUF4135 domain-containing protein [Comamonadaceae bacterium]|nr:DUF4135 domain-containing protein [Comamonadaceae bacterium]